MEKQYGFYEISLNFSSRLIMGEKLTKWAFCDLLCFSDLCLIGEKQYSVSDLASRSLSEVRVNWGLLGVIRNNVLNISLLAK